MDIPQQAQVKKSKLLRNAVLDLHFRETINLNFETGRVLPSPPDNGRQLTNIKSAGKDRIRSGIGVSRG